LSSKVQKLYSETYYREGTKRLHLQLLNWRLRVSSNGTFLLYPIGTSFSPLKVVTITLFKD